MKSGCMYQDITLDPQRLAIYLAMTKSLEEEKQMTAELQKLGIKCAATMATGVNMDISGKVLNGVIGACLNAGIVEKSGHICILLFTQFWKHLELRMCSRAFSRTAA